MKKIIDLIVNFVMEIAFDIEAPQLPKGGDEIALKFISKINRYIHKFENKLKATLVSPFRGVGGFHLESKLSFLLIFFFTINLTAQDVRRLDIDWEVDGVISPNALAGGLNAPQLSEVDLNNDGVLDLYIFDRAGDVHLTFLNNGSTNGKAYEFAPEFTANFPAVTDFVLLRDYNGDGIMDLFAFSDVPGINGFIVYKGSYFDNKIAFTRVNIFGENHNILYTEIPNGTTTQIYVPRDDYPAIDDIDGDGDLDILSFDVGGSVVIFYKNQSVENGHGLDSLEFKTNDLCFGKFKEDGLDATIFLSDDPNSCASLWNPTADVRHSGSTILSYDADGDADKELVIGDLSSNNLVWLHNEGTFNNAWMNAQDETFPSDNVSVDMPIFIASFHLDLDNDGNKDFVAAPNNFRSAEDDQNVWFYKNVTDNTNPIFEKQEETFLVKEMLDNGTGANPTFVDYNADGLMDIVVGNSTYYLTGGAKDSRLFLYENIGTLNEPHYRLADDNYLNLNQYNSNNQYWNYDPAFGDLDSDGDLDLLVAEETGRLVYFENTAGAGNPLAFATPDLFWKGIDLPQGPTLQIVDVNRDGLLDLLCGRRLGTVMYLPNIGTSTAPDFHADPFESPNDFKFGDVDLRTGQDANGSASPMLIDRNGEYVLYCGSERGQIEVYENIDDNLDGTFTLVNSNYGNIREGKITHPTIADINGNGTLDVLVGNSRGGLGFFTTDLPVNTIDFKNDLSINIFPNPIDQFFYLEIEGLNGKQADLRIYNTIGQTILEKNLLYEKNGIDVGYLSAGIYFCEVIVGNRRGVKKLVIK